MNPLVSNKGKFNRIFADSVNINSADGELRIYKSKNKVNQTMNEMTDNPKDLEDSRDNRRNMLSKISEEESKEDKMI